MSNHATAQHHQDTAVSAEAFNELHSLLGDRLTTAKDVRVGTCKRCLSSPPPPAACRRIPP